MIDCTNEQNIKLVANGYRYPVTLKYDGERIWVRFPYNKALLNEIKSMEGAKWHGYEDPPVKAWTIKNSQRNKFQLRYLQGEDVYARFDVKDIDILPNRNLFQNQIELLKSGILHKIQYWAAEMGLGKSLAFIELMESVGVTGEQVWYVGPKAGVRAFTRELLKWQSRIWPCKIITYENLVKVMKNGSQEQCPKMVCFDESSKIKTPSAQRSQAARHLADSMRDEYGDDAHIILMSGTPSPKDPSDWWNQCELLCPGFLKEGDREKFKRRLCIIEDQKDEVSGGVYPKLITWLDDEHKCAKCGQFIDSIKHKVTSELDGGFHTFVQSKNEIQYLYQRLRGLVTVQFKKDCTDLPEKRYEVIRIQPTIDLLRAAKIILAHNRRAVQTLAYLRELSDGFQYVDEYGPEYKCPFCNDGMIKSMVLKEEFLNQNINTANLGPDAYEDGEIPCGACGGSGKRADKIRETQVVGSPKDQVFIEELDEHAEIGRYVVWGGFTATIDRLVKLAHDEQWATLRIDGRGLEGTLPDGTIIPTSELLDAMDLSHPKYSVMLDKYPRLTVVGQPGAGGMAYTFTAAPTMLYYSNTFNGEDRMQSEDRCHRLGMDKNKGLLIKDIIMLPTDQKVLDNIKQKKKLQNLSLGELMELMK